MPKKTPTKKTAVASASATKKAPKQTAAQTRAAERAPRIALIPTTYPPVLVPVVLAFEEVKWKPGNCYEDAWVFVCCKHREAVLCHGVAVGTGGAVFGKEYGHAWAEVTIDGKTLCISAAGVHPAETFYRVGDLHAVKKYTAEEATEIGNRRGATYGPWDHAEIDKAEGAFGRVMRPTPKKPASKKRKMATS